MIAAQRIEWPAGTRVRCVDATYCTHIVDGGTYRLKVPYRRGDGFVYLRGIPEAYCAHRFKPIVRVKMGRAEAPVALDPFLRSFASC